jgi:class 3 adenylate cyclase
VLGRGASDGNVAVTGEATNLAARLQAAARAGEIVLSAEAHRRVERHLGETGLSAEPEQLELKGIDAPQPAFRVGAAAEVGAPT